MTILGAAGNDAAAYWYFTRATGLVALVLLSATVVLGIVSSMGWTTPRWPRFLSQGLHRNLSLYCLAVVVVHVGTTVAEGYVPISVADAVIPFRSPYRTLWIGLGALAFDLLLAVLVTSALRRRIGFRLWRGVHWAAYACWPVAVLHGLGSGTDTRLPVALVLYGVCIVAVGGALVWRLLARPLPAARPSRPAGPPLGPPPAPDRASGAVLVTRGARSGPGTRPVPRGRPR